MCDANASVLVAHLKLGTSRSATRLIRQLRDTDTHHAKRVRQMLDPYGSIRGKSGEARVVASATSPAPRAD